MLLFSMCNTTEENGEKKLSTDIVNNPVTANGNKTSKDFPKISFETDIHNFGKVIQGEKVTYSFKFKNTGNANLIISDVSSSCGCTVPKFTREPVAPGESGSIQVTFKSENKKGFQNETVTIVSNMQPNTKVIKIKAMVIIPEENY